MVVLRHAFSSAQIEKIVLILAELLLRVPFLEMLSRDDKCRPQHDLSRSLADRECQGIALKRGEHCGKGSYGVSPETFLVRTISWISWRLSGFKAYFFLPPLGF